MTSAPTSATLAHMSVATIFFDGGTPSNNPRHYGDGYGSYRIDRGHGTGQIIRCKFERPMSCNAAEIWTLVQALRDLEADPGTFAEHTSIWARGDSKIALKWAGLSRKANRKPPHAETSAEFRLAIIALWAASGPFKSLACTWHPREQSVAIFGH